MPLVSLMAMRVALRGKGVPRVLIVENELECLSNREVLR